ncbi:hypothetical protein Thiosp_03646 [Thiorhodovibrio litoralis]|nr:hypothetical protein Thiosp_03646 [Thiorhodovibrio litoralis]
MLTEPSFHANVECLHRYLVAIREKQPTKADRPEDDQELEFIKRDLTCICGLTRGICISVAASLCGVLVAYSGDCFEILESDHVITKHLAGGLRTAVRSWELFATVLAAEQTCG